MAINKQLKEMVLVFELKNKQDSYARCLSTINYFEDKFQSGENIVKDFYSHLNKIPESEYTFSLNQRANEPNYTMDYPGPTGKYARIPVSKEEEEEFLIYAVESWRKEKEKLRRPFYHIRIKFDYDSESGNYRNLDNLQFLAMLMQQVYIKCFGNESGQFIPKKLQERMGVILVPHTGNSYNFVGEDKNPDTSLYLLASQYLRLIAKMHNGVIYGCSSSGKVETVNFNKRVKDIDFFPLLYLTRMGLIDNYSAIFEKSGMCKPSVIRDALLFQLKEKIAEPLPNIWSENPHEAIADIIIDEARENIIEFFSSIPRLKKDKIISTYIEEIIKYVNQCDRITFALFGFLLFSEEKDEAAVLKAIKETMRLARELGDGIRQIVQNSLQYSQYHECYISFYKTKTGNSHNGYEDQLYVRVTDINNDANMTDTFNKILKAEKKSDTFDINGVEISIKQLISEFDLEDKEVLEDWYSYRRIDSSAHIGLTMFKNTLKRCRCKEVQIISQIEFKWNEEKRDRERNTFTASFENADNKDKLFSLPEHIIPGTQIAFSIPITTLKRSSTGNLVQLANHDAFTEDYDAFAHYLDYEISEHKWDEIIKKLSDNPDIFHNMKITDADSKIKAQDHWNNFWQVLLSSAPGDKKEIHLYDLNEDPSLKNNLNEKDNCEVFIKGYLAAASVLKEMKPSYFYFINFPAHFIEVFQEVAVPLSVMKYSQNIQIFFSCEDTDKTEDDNHKPGCLLLFGNCVGHVIQNAYILSLEHGENGVETLYYKYCFDMLSPYKNILDKPVIQKVCPFSVFELPSSHDSKPQYFRQIEEIISRDLVNINKNERGYKLNDIHMRLGNKVHVNSFYEMSFLFYRTSVANRVAFYILKNFIKEKLSEANDNIVFYGYASYSQPMVVSLQEILLKYLKTKDIEKKVYYAVYQYNLQSESFLLQSAMEIRNDSLNIDDKIQIYSTFKLNDSKAKKPKTSVVQIVPIGSTLTTFGKMRAKYTKERDEKEKSAIIENYNVVLVRDNNEIKKENGVTEIEKELWEKFDAENRVVTINKLRLKDLAKGVIGDVKISFIINKEAKWSKPTKCKDCFPDEVNKEKPLIETDPTSTVPTLQLYQKNKLLPAKNDVDNDAIIRLSELKDCIYYGHFIRGKNHFQYYIDTQEYISRQKIKEQLEKWLKEERKKESDEAKEKAESTITPVLNIIFSPEHNKNVGFSQLVNNYYFNGTAEIVSVNIDKQFRSNFVCEHDALKQTIQHLIDECPENEIPVRFFFADDSIITGGYYNRARSLLQSLIPEGYRSKDGYYPVFSKCFFLIDRFSANTREAYIINPEDNFLSFCKINISNIRTQGDSCIGCKLEQEAKYLHKRSSTRGFANHWASREYDPVMFSNTNRIKEYGGINAFVRMLLTHAADKLIPKNNIDSTNITYIFTLILKESKKPDNNNDNHEMALIKKAFQALLHEYDTEDKKIIYLIGHIIKILTRPFISYNFEIKKFVLGFIVDICESILAEKSNNETAREIKNILIKADWQDRFDFINDCLFEALADMRSTYLLRKETIKNVYKFSLKYCGDVVKTHNIFDDIKKYHSDKNNIRGFWRKYAFHIHKIIDGAGDETRSLWMEYLFLSGDEFTNVPGEDDKIGEGFPPLFIDIIKGFGGNEYTEQLFKEFCTEIFFQNSRLLFDGIEKAYENKSESDPDENNYFLSNMTQMRKWNYKWAGIEPKKITDAEKDMFGYFMSKIDDDRDIKTKYGNFIKKIENLIYEKYAYKTDTDKYNLRIAIVTQNDDDDKINMNNLEFIAENIPNKYNPDKKAEAKYIIKQRIIWALRQNLSNDDLINIYGKSRLPEDGYILIEAFNDNDKSENQADNKTFNFETDNNNYCKPFFILRFDQEEDSGKQSGKKPEEKVYIYVRFSFQADENKKEKIVPILIMRDILSYRNRIMRILKRDFNNNLMQVDARKTGVTAMFKHEKAVSHASTSDDQLPIMALGNNRELKQNEYEWLLFRNYTNTQIAKIFNRVLLPDDEDLLKQNPKLYLKDTDINPETDFSLPAKTFMNNLWNDTDRRVILCNSIIDFEINGLDKVKLITPDSGKGYFNQEYLKCVLFDIILSCAKYWNEDADFLARVENLKNFKDEYQNIKDNYINDPDYADNFKAANNLRCIVLMLRDKNNLVLINPVDITGNLILGGLKEHNEKIMIRLKNPYNSFSGQMSLFTINNYIKGNCGEDSEFKYIYYKDLKMEWAELLREKWNKNIDDESLWFISKLPVFTKEE